MQKTVIRLGKLAGLLMGICMAGAQADDLAKTSQNPVGDIISLPTEVWHYSGMPGGTEANLFFIKPVYPVTVGSVNIINRLIVPYTDLNGPDKGIDLGGVEIQGNSGGGAEWLG